MKNEITFFQTNTYGKIISTSKDIEKDKVFLSNLLEKLNECFQIHQKSILQNGVDIQKDIHSRIYGALSAVCVGESKSIELFSSNIDHRGRPCDRYVVMFSGREIPDYIVDIFAEAEQCVNISPVTRFMCLHLPRTLTRELRKNIEVGVKINHVIRVWNTPCSYYKIVFEETYMSIENLSDSFEHEQKCIGLPNYIKPTERGVYERSDLETRRAIFKDTFSVFKDRTSWIRPKASDGDNS